MMCEMLKFRQIVARSAAAIVLAMVAATATAQDAKAPDKQTAAGQSATSAAGSPLAAPPAGTPAEVIVPPSDPIAKAAFEVLEKNCSRCHQSGRLVSRERPAKQFGNILKLD